MMRAWVVAAMLLAGCKHEGATDERDDPETEPCNRELTKIAPMFVDTLGGGDPAAFEQRTDSFAKGSMCGPDLGTALRDWTEYLRAKDPAVKARALRELDAINADGSWKAPAPLAQAIAKAKTAAP